MCPVKKRHLNVQDIKIWMLTRHEKSTEMYAAFPTMK